MFSIQCTEESRSHCGRLHLGGGVFFTPSCSHTPSHLTLQFPCVSMSECISPTLDFGISYKTCFGQWDLRRWDTKPAFAGGPSLLYFCPCHEKDVPWVGCWSREDETHCQRSRDSSENWSFPSHHGQSLMAQPCPALVRQPSANW